MKIKIDRISRMLEALTDQVNDEREQAAVDDSEYTDALWPDEAEQNTERGFLLAKSEEFLNEIRTVLSTRGKIVIDVEES